MDAGAEAYLTIEKSLYRVVQDILKKDKNLFQQVVVEIVQDAQTFKAAIAFAQNQQQQQPAQ